MSTYRLQHLFAPTSVAVAGASPREGSLGRVVLASLRRGGFAGALHAVNPKYAEVDGVPCRAAVRDVPGPLDLLVVATPAGAVPDVIADAIAAGTRAAIVLTAGLGRGPGSIAQRTHDIARAGGLRIVGPNCLGVLAPPARLDASFAARTPPPGPLAVVSQSGAVAVATIEWAAERGVGLAAVCSLGDAMDVDFGDCLDWFAEDRSVGAILLYVESISDARKFMSAARAAARLKPVVVMKAGRHAQGAKAAATHTGALAGSDAVYDAAFRRAGCVRAFDMDDFFAAANTLARCKPFEGDRLAVLTNGGGVGVLAVDRLMDLGGRLADLSAATVARLDRVLPPTWSRANPVDVIGDAPPQRYADAMDALLEDPQADAILAINCPTGIASSSDAADATLGALRRRREAGLQAKQAFAVWLGADAALRGRFEASGVPTFANEADAVRGAMHLVDYRRRLDDLMRVAEAPPRIAPDRAAAAAAIAAALRDGRRWLDALEVSAVLAAYGVCAVPATLARTPQEAAELAAPLLAGSSRCAVKILSRDIAHKSDVGGVALNLASADAVREAAAEILARARVARPQARIDGVTLHPMIERRHARETIAGVAVDPTFGPIALFGSGGVSVEAVDDKAIDLLPLDLPAARALVGRPRIARLLRAYRSVPAADVEAAAQTLVRLSRLAEDFPEIVGLDLNPLLLDAEGALALDARIEVAPPGAAMRPGGRFAVRPYPREWESEAALRDGSRVRLRPIRPDDEAALRAMLERTQPEDLRLRFHGRKRAFDRRFLARLTQIDYARSMALVAVDPADGALLGVVRLHGDADRVGAEYAVLVRSDLKGRGLGWLLMGRILDYARAEGYAEVRGEILRENDTMLRMCEKLGFRVRVRADDPGAAVATLRLAPCPAAA